MRPLVACVVLALAAPVARADGPATLASIGAGVTNQGPGAQWLVEVAYRPVDGWPLRAHAMFAKGGGDLEDYGSFRHWQLRGGIEAAACQTPVFCWILDLDAGLLRVNADDLGAGGSSYSPPIDRDGFLLGGRGGFDTGGRTMRFRMMLDVAGALEGPFLVHDGFGGKVDLSSVSSLEVELTIAF